MGRTYSNDVENAPELIALCLNCTQEDCAGRCGMYFGMRAEIYARMGKQQGRRSNKRLFHGEWLTIAEIERRTGINRSTLDWRMRHGMTLEEAVAMGRPETDHKRGVMLKTPEINGLRLPENRWAERLGVSKYVFYKYLHAGHTLEEAVAHFSAVSAASEQPGAPTDHCTLTTDN